MKPHFEARSLTGGFFMIVHADMSARNLARQTMGGNFPSTFRQFDGTNYAMNLALLSGGEYDLYGGDLTASNLVDWFAIRSHPAAQSSLCHPALRGWRQDRSP